MGCFLACFGSSKDRRRRKQRNKVLPRDQRHGVYRPVQSTVSLEHDISETPISADSELQDKPEVHSNISPKKKVRFDSNVKTYEHISAEEQASKKEKNKEESGQYHSASDDGSVISSLGSYPQNHRYQNCRDSDDEDGELEFEESDLEEFDDVEEDYNDFGEEELSMESRTGILASRVITQEVYSPLPFCDSPDHELKTVKSNPNVRDRSTYVHPVLNPVENLTQWKSVKARENPPLKQQKENFTMDQESLMPFSPDPILDAASFDLKKKSNQSKLPNQEIAVDASLSNWLGSSETTPLPIRKTSSIASETFTSAKSASPGSNSPMSLEDRPILGALTVEEIRQFSASSSPRKSPSRSPDDMPIIGTVGTYWGHNERVEDSGSVSSYKGIPNTTSKYSEDKTVNWHSTPFETRLERALNRGV